MCRFWTNFVIALVWCVVGCFIGFARPDLPHARLAFAGAVAVGVAFTPLGRLVHPLHVVLGPHFFSRFPAGRPVTGSAKWILVLLYAVAVVSVAPVWWREIAQLVLGFPAVTAAVAANQWVFAFAALLRLWVFYLAIVAIVIVAVRNQRALRTEDQRRRMRWVAYGSSLALAPQIVWSVAEYVVSPAAAARLGLPANLISIGVPVVIAYAVVKHRMFDIRVVVRRGVQYLLARSALQCLLAVPVVALAYTVVVQRDRTIAELAVEGSGYLYWIVIAGLSLRFRQPIRLWLDRRFFREQHDVEQVLFAVVDDLGKAESIGHLSELVSTTVDSALHPTTVYVWYRDAGELAAASSSNPLLSPADLPAGGRWLSWLEAHGTGADVPMPADAGLSRRELQWFAARGICLAMPILDNGERLAGVVLLGPKKSDEPYGLGDRRLLQALTTQAGVVRETLRLRAQVTEDRRIRHDVLARLDRTHSTLLKECPVCGTCFDAAAERCERDGEPLTLTLPISRMVDDRYRLDRLIGKGGMGAVYEARALRLERDVAARCSPAGVSAGRQPAASIGRRAPWRDSNTRTSSRCTTMGSSRPRVRTS